MKVQALSISFALAFVIGLLTVPSNAEAYKYKVNIKNSYKWSVKIKKVVLKRVSSSTSTSSKSMNKTIDKCVAGINCYKSWSFSKDKSTKYQYTITYKCQTKLLGKWKTRSFTTKLIASDSTDNDSTTFITVKNCSAKFSCSADTGSRTNCNN